MALSSERRLRRSSALVVLFDKDTLVIFNFLTRQIFTCNSLCLNILSRVADWQDETYFFSLLPGYSREGVLEQIDLLVAMGALVVEGSDAAIRDERYAKTWEWGTIAGLYHFAIQDYEYTDDPDLKAELVSQRAALRPSPSLYITNEQYATVIELPLLQKENPVFAAMLARRTQRAFGHGAIRLQDLANCLYAGLGITGFMEFPVFGRLPLKPTPSGGARNPYEAYVYALRVEGMPPGIYHYSALENSLGLLSSEGNPAPHQLLSSQLWTDDAAAIILLVADYDRMMWKYPHPAAYRVVLMEAGHIGQNIILAATSCGLVTAMTAAISDAIAKHTLQLISLTQSVVYAIMIGEPQTDPIQG
jgi:SagB-type dehydrogenase family enzyme